MAAWTITVSDVETAIQAVLTGKSVSINGRSYTHESLDQLLKLREVIAAASSRTAGTSRAFIRFQPEE